MHCWCQRSTVSRKLLLDVDDDDADVNVVDDDDELDHLSKIALETCHGVFLC